MSETTTSTGFDFSKLMENGKRFVTRTVRGDFQTEHATEEEKHSLATARVPVTQGLSQDYAAWRRGILWVMIAFMSVKCLLDMIEWIGFMAQDAAEAGLQGAGDIFDTLRFLSTILFLAVVVALVFYVIAALKWTDMKRTRRFARLGWLVMFATPLVLSGIPWPSIAGLPENAPEQAKLFVGFMFGAALFFYVAPGAVSLCIGAVRSSMVLKTLIPESSAPGWAAVLFAPIYVIILLALVVLINQMAGNLLLMVALLCLLGAPLVYVFRAKDVIRPHTPEEVTSVIRPIRLTYTIFMLSGVVLLGIWVLDLGLGVLDLLRLMIGILASILALIVVASDFILALINNSYQQSKEFHGSGLAQDLDAKFEELSSVGLTRMKLKYMTSEIDSSSIADAVEQVKREQAAEDEAE